jgi:hypothetical protein
MSRYTVGAIILTAALLAGACGTGASRVPTATPGASATPGGAMTAIVATAVVVTAVVVTPGGPPPASATPGPAASATVAPPTSTPPPGGITGIAGTVMVGPTCPVERPESPCPDRPYATKLTFWRGGSQVAETESAADGRFFVALPPGRYTIVVESPGPLPHCGEQVADVVEGQLTRVQMTCDSGIR